jgi:hypothetical protein
MFTTQVLNFRIDENLESTLLPIARATDFYRFKFESRMVPHTFQHKLHVAERRKRIVTSED